MVEDSKTTASKPRACAVSFSMAKHYREAALKLLPHICARCGREFAGRRLRELTVHHRDGNHDHNPPDGSNWELLCIYCHENEHARVEDFRSGTEPDLEPKPAKHRPLEGLADMLKKKK